jgi:ABC-type lipoprotein release transport system permease subunit
VGTPASLVAATVMLETALVGGAGTAVGLSAGLAAVQVTALTGVDLSWVLGDTSRFYVDPLVRPHLDPVELLTTGAAAFGASLAAGVYPALRAARMHPVRALWEA